MKYWQKVFFCTLILFLISFDVIGYLLIAHSFTLNKESAKENARSEENVIGRSIYEQLSNKTADNLSDESIQSMMIPYGGYYEMQDVFFALYKDAQLCYASFPDNIQLSFSNTAPEEKTISLKYFNENLYCMIETSFIIEDTAWHFIYLKDVQQLVELRNDMVHLFITISIGTGIVLSLILLILLQMLTKPFRKLNQAASMISEGNYEKRVDIKGNDEVGTFALHFNQMAAAMETHIEKLSTMNTQKEQFIHDLSHEMRTPLTAILGYSELLKLGNLEPDEREHALHYIIHASNRLQFMSDKILKLAYMDYSHIERTPTNLHAVITHCIETCKITLQEKKITLTTDLQAFTISGNETLLESLFQNILENAIRATKVGGEIHISSHIEKDMGVVILQDNGVGMPTDELAKIREPFYRIDEARSRENGGVGLGLYICSRICELHHAEFDIVSQINEGTTIRLEFTTILQDSSILETSRLYDV